MSEQTIALVTGANKGIGYEIAAGLGALGWRIGVGARDPQRRDAAVEKLRAAGADAFGVPLDVTDDASVAAAAELIADEPEGSTCWSTTPAITGGMPQTAHARSSPRPCGAVVETNVIGVIRVTNAMLPLLRALAVAADREHVQQRRLAHPADHARRRHRARSPPPTRRPRPSSTPSPSSTPRS